MEESKWQDLHKGKVSKKGKDTKLNVISLWHFQTEQTFLKCNRTGGNSRASVILKQRNVTGR